MRSRFDRFDFFIALGLFTCVSAWAFLWAHPCPHPDVWSFLVAVHGCVDIGLFGLIGRFALGLLAAAGYLLLRGAGLCFLEVENDSPDRVRFARAVAGCGALIYVFIPYVWRAGESLSPIFVFIVLVVVGMLFVLPWRFGRLSFLFAAVGSAGLIFVARRLAQMHGYGRLMRGLFLALLATITSAMLLRSVDLAERVRLQAMSDYAALVAEDVRQAKYLFTDGRFDDLLRLTFAARRLQVEIMNTMMSPTTEESERLKALAPEVGEREIFAAGGAEVFKAWARERPDRLAESAWQLGGGTVRRHGKVESRTSGSLSRCADAACASADDEADARFAEWSRHLLSVVEPRSVLWKIFGGTDEATRRKFDALLWRAARMADERGESELMKRLDEFNTSLRNEGEILERMLPTGKLVLTSREALGVALKRADFELAQRYAKEVLIGAPDDPSANFALGMANMESRDYLSASICFERALKQNPREPAALNNLAIAYMKLGQGEKALACAERAAEAYPQSTEILKTREEIRKNMTREHEKDANEERR